MKAETRIGPARLVDLPARPTVGLRFEAPYSGMFASVTKFLKELRAWVAVHAKDEPGPYFLRYHRVNMGAIMDLEVGFVLRTPRTAEGLISGSLPAGRYATLIYSGKGLRSNQALFQWMREHEVRSDSYPTDAGEVFACRYEMYLTDFRVESRKLLWEIELSVMVKE